MQIAARKERLFLTNTKSSQRYAAVEKRHAGGIATTDLQLTSL